MTTKPSVLVVGREWLCDELVSCLRKRGVECLCVGDGAKAAAVVDVAEREGSSIEVAFLSSFLQQAQLEWLLTYLRAKEAFRISRIIVLGAENASKIEYWTRLGATSCVGSTPKDVELTAAYWASVLDRAQ